MLLPERRIPAQVRDMVQFYPELKVGYARIVTISTDNALKANEFRDGEGAQWPFLSDPEHTLQSDRDIKEYTDPTNDPMIPHTLVLEPGLKIYQDLHGLLVLGAPLNRRIVVRPSRHYAADPG